MILNPGDAIAEGILSLNEGCQIEFNTTVIPLVRVFKLGQAGLRMGVNEWQNSSLNECAPVKDRRTGIDYWKLSPAHAYFGESNLHVSLKDDMTMLLSPTPVLVRNGISLNYALPDSYATGNVKFGINVSCESIIAVGAPVARTMILQNENYDITITRATSI